jgi:hypothetical protein
MTETEVIEKCVLLFIELTGSLNSLLSTTYQFITLFPSLFKLNLFRACSHKFSMNDRVLSPSNRRIVNSIFRDAIVRDSKRTGTG